jgi:hypothetical protein
MSEEAANTFAAPLRALKPVRSAVAETERRAARKMRRKKERRAARRIGRKEERLDGTEGREA